VGYPDRYWTEVQRNAVGYRYEPRLLHALVREESNFNQGIVSHAGAKGLSQLMPGTAREVAGWLGVSVGSLDDPDTNLRLGGRYLEAMHKQLGDSPYLSLAAYNAGAGRVNEWFGEWGNLPTDEYVERIPFRETRGYVKRVMGTWQTERWQFDSGAAFYDLSAFNHHAKKVP
jgi:soluble lytic murein transglycosylase